MPSGVPDQPIGYEQTRQGACNRAHNALKKINADIGVGLEGGIVDTEVGMLSMAWCCLVDNQGTVSYGGGMHFHLPDLIAKQIRQGKELGVIMKKLNKQYNRHHQGTIGILTNNLLTRTQEYKNLVQLAVTKFVASDMFV